MGTLTKCIATRFELEDFKIYVNIQEILLNSFASERCDTELAEVMRFGFSKVKRTTFAFTTDSRVSDV